LDSAGEYPAPEARARALSGRGKSGLTLDLNEPLACGEAESAIICFQMADKDLVFRIKADFLKSLAHPLRLQIIEYLKNKEASVGEMVKAIGVEQSGLSKHLSILRMAGILSSRQEKATVFYSIRDNDIFHVLRPIAEILRKKLKESQGVLAHLGQL